MDEEVDILDGYECTVHKCELYGRDCERCWGEGGYHDCGEDCCCCADPEEPNSKCEDCRGTGRIKWCPEWTEVNPCNKKSWKELPDRENFAY